MKLRPPTEMSGPLEGHVREGRRYASPLAATGLLQIGDWVRDDLPDLLWPVLTLAELGTAAAQSFVRWQGEVQGDLAGHVEPRLLGEGLDGRLTSLDRLTEHYPKAAGVIRNRVRRFGLLPLPVAKVLAFYRERPASWLIDLEVEHPDEEDVKLLARALKETLTDGHREAVIKCLPIWSAVQAGTFSADESMIDLLKKYPNDPTTRARADTSIRASWGAIKGMQLANDASRFDASIKWAMFFWGINSMTTRCMRQIDLEEATPTPEEAEPASATPDDGSNLRQLAMDLMSSYVEALETAPSRLYDPERQEVHAGLVGRAARETITALGAPDLWCIEHGAHIGRTLVEVRIYLEWMALQDPSIYRTYQEYGAGKAKLYARIASEIPQEWWRPGLKDAVGELDRLSHNHDILDHRVVDTSDSFAGGKSLRAMAEECGQLDLYRRTYYLASGVTHSEWWSVETHCMERCLNILHRGHLIPSLSLSAAGNVDLATSWVDALYALIQASLSILGTDKQAVNDAFSWIAAEDELQGTDQNDRGGNSAATPKAPVDGTVS